MALLRIHTRQTQKTRQTIRKTVSAAASALARPSVHPGVSSVAGATLRGGGAILQPAAAHFGRSPAFTALQQAGIASSGVLGISIQGLEETAQVLDTVAQAAAAMAATTFHVTNPQPYAYGIQYGVFYHSGQVARYAGGSFALIRAMLSVYPALAPKIAQSLPNGPQAVLSALNDVATRIRDQASRNEVIGPPTDPHRGQLRGAYMVTVGNG